MKDDRGDEVIQGVYAGTSPDEKRLDPLDLICELAKQVAGNALAEFGTEEFRDGHEVFGMLRRAQRLLVLNQRHVPHDVDQVLDAARGNGGLRD